MHKKKGVSFLHLFSKKSRKTCNTKKFKKNFCTLVEKIETVFVSYKKSLIKFLQTC